MSPRSAPSGPNLADIGEFGFLSRLLGRLPRSSGTIVGPGQDCAVIRSGGKDLLVTVDALVEEVHFASRWLQPQQIGRKSFLVNASDIAAMGGRPRFCVVSFGVPPAYPVRQLTAVQHGIVAAARQCGATVVGGNLTRAKELFVSITLIGAAPRRRVTRQGARPGDRIYVTGALGDAGLVVHMLSGRPARRPPAAALRRFTEPPIRWKAGQYLVESGIASAMIDVSDGLVQDLGHICTESRVGARVRAAAVPVSPAYRRILQTDLRLALSGGEDYELLCTVPERHVRRLEANTHRLGCPITCIGMITRGRQVRVELDGGDTLAVRRAGFDHFRGARR